MGQYNSNLQLQIIKNKDEAIRLLHEAEQKDFYIEECLDDHDNMIARHNLQYTPNTINDYEYDTAMSFLKSNYNKIPTKLQNELYTVNIIILMPSAEGGMPHTRPSNIICYPDISQLYSITTLIHELWHLHQRTYQEKWFQIFHKLGWSYWSGSIPSSINSHRRFNPDTIDYPLWIFRNRWIPIPVFRNISSPIINEVDIWFYNPIEKKHVKQIPYELRKLFPKLSSPSAYEHPRELTAYILSESEKYNTSIYYKYLL